MAETKTIRDDFVVFHHPYPSMHIKKKCLIIIGSARSGTSWLAEVLASVFRYRLLFEPYNDQYVPDAKCITDRFLYHDGRNPDVDRFLRKVFRNRIDNDWIGQNSYRRFKMHMWPFWAKRHIIKFVRAGLAASSKVWTLFALKKDKKYYASA